MSQCNTTRTKHRNHVCMRAQPPRFLAAQGRQGSQELLPFRSSSCVRAVTALVVRSLPHFQSLRRYMDETSWPSVVVSVFAFLGVRLDVVSRVPNLRWCLGLWLGHVANAQCLTFGVYVLLYVCDCSIGPFFSFPSTRSFPPPLLFNECVWMRTVILLLLGRHRYVREVSRAGRGFV